MRQALPVAFLSVFATLAAGRAHATVVAMPSLEEMTVAADVVVHGVVVDQEVVADQDRMLTRTTLLVKEAVKGAHAGDRIVIQQVGGGSTRRGGWIVGAHHFAVQEELVFFGTALVPPGTEAPPAKGQANVFVTYGIGFGTFDVVADSTGVKVVEVIGDVVAVTADKDGKTRTEAPRPRRFDSVPTFLNTLRAYDKLVDLPKLRKLAPPTQRRAPAAAAAKGGAQ